MLELVMNNLDLVPLVVAPLALGVLALLNPPQYINDAHANKEHP